MKEKIFAFLKTKLPGVPKSYLNGVADEYSKTISEESEIETVLTDGVVSVLKFSAGQIQTEGDRRATEATSTAISTYEEKYGLKDGKEPTPAPPGTPKPPTETPENDVQAQVAAALKAALEPITEKLTAIETQKLQENLSVKAKARLTELKIPEKFVGKINVNSDEEVEAFVESEKERYDEFRQDMVDNGQYIETPKSPIADIGKDVKDYQKIMDGEDTEDSGTVKLDVSET
jgi:hypothetical protein